MDSVRKGIVLASAIFLFLLVIPVAAKAADKPGSGATVSTAWGLYTQRRYAESADAFEQALKNNRPSARLYYHAALANYAANRKERCAQLCNYITSTFVMSEESKLCRTMLANCSSSSSASTAASASTGISTPAASNAPGPDGPLDEKNLPAGFYASLPADVRAALKTPAGKLRLKQAVIDYNKRLAEQKKNTVASAATPSHKHDDNDEPRSATFTVDKSLKRNDYPFTAAQIARDGANGIDQSVNPNCWFEASMAALAELPRGQKLLASMIRYDGNGGYIVRFPGDGQEYKITERILEQKRIRDRALWASLLECAQVMKFPDNRGAEGETGDQSRLAVGLGCITGCQAQLISPGSADPQELSSFIGSAVSSKNPIVCGTWHESALTALPSLVVPRHAYTIIGFNPATNMITIRNPHGKHSTKFYSDDRGKFEMMENGIFKMHLSLFQKYFNQVCRSFI